MPGDVINVFVAICQLIFFLIPVSSPFDYFCSTGLKFFFFLGRTILEIQLRILLSNQFFFTRW